MDRITGWRLQAAMLFYGCVGCDDRYLSCGQGQSRFEVVELVVPIPDDELERLASKHRPESVEANALADLCNERARDRQVFTFRLGDFIVIEPESSAEEELVFMLANEATKHLKAKN